MLMPSKSGSGYYPGAVTETCFPYEASVTNCSLCSNPTYTPVISWGYVTNGTSIPTTAAIKQAIYTYGSVSAAVYADSAFQAYTGGVFNENASGSPNHGIVLCGWDDSKGAWLLKNSWGTGWGIGGFMWIAYGSNSVGYAAAWATSNGGSATTYSISGTVSGAVTSGVTMTLSGAASKTTTTASDGSYTFSGLANGSYTVTPSKSGYTFSPTSIAVTISGANQTGKNFTATASSGGDTPLTSGVPVNGSVAYQAWNYYTIAVPSGATGLTITLTNLSADIDLYVNNNTTHPTTSSYYGRSWNSGTTNESLSYTNPTVGTWCIGAYGYAAGSYTVTATVTTSSGSTTLFSNGFESSTGWAQVNTSGTAGSWSRVTSGTYPTCSPHGGSYMAKFNSYSASSGSATRYYQTSGFAISSSYTTVTLTFWMYHDTGYSSYADKIQPQVSTNGSTWVNVGSAINRYDGSTGWKQHTVNISTYKGQTVYLGFLATSAYGNNMYIDDVVVTAQ
jgi:hypothetical protein